MLETTTVDTTLLDTTLLETTTVYTTMLDAAAFYVGDGRNGVPARNSRDGYQVSGELWTYSQTLNPTSLGPMAIL